MRVFLLFIFSFSLLAGEPIFDNNGVTVEYDQEKDIYEVKKNGKLDSRRVIQNYKDIPKMKELLESLGAKVSEEAILVFNNNLMKSLKAPSEKQVMEVGSKRLEEINSFATSNVNSGSSCSVYSDVARDRLRFDSVGKEKQKGWFCAAPSSEELSDSWSARKAAEKAREDRTFMKRWLGDNVSHTITTDTYNDNFLHGGGIALTGKQTADDRARTYGHALEYEAEGDEGSFSVRYQSTLFGREVTREGPYGYQYYRNEDGEKYLEAMEETTLTLKGTRKFSEDKSLYGVGSLSFRERTDENRGSQSLQNSWHEMSGSIIYDYQEFMDDEYSIEAKVGVGKKIEGDLGKWRCKAVVEGLAGVDMWSMDRAELEINASVGLDSGTWGGREKVNPWIAIDAYTNQSIDTDGLYESMYGTKVSTSFKWGKSSIRPYLGIEYYDQESDRMFQTATEGNELIHTIGVEVSF